MTNRMTKEEAAVLRDSKRLPELRRKLREAKRKLARAELSVDSFKLRIGNVTYGEIEVHHGVPLRIVRYDYVNGHRVDVRPVSETSRGRRWAEVYLNAHNRVTYGLRCRFPGKDGWMTEDFRGAEWTSREDVEAAAILWVTDGVLPPYNGKVKT